MTVLRHLLSILMLPVVVTVVVPRLVLFGHHWWPPDGPLELLAIVASILVLATGLAVVVATIRHFATVGHGTLAPWDPPRQLVVTGIYRRVRNPMISGVLSILIGEVLLFRSLPLLAWAAVVGTLNAIYIPLVEERGLAQRFGDEYRQYKQHVPRWLPRRTPWTPPWA
jgi:protein-S-isoprenylcysteine O-methyltransferase Ste14